MASTRRAYAGRSADERDEQRRRQLLDAGLDVFGTTGFRTATVRGLCREARVADRSFYELFPTTEDLLLAVYRDCIARLTAAVTTAIGDDADGDALEAVARRGLTAFFDVIADPRVARVVWLEVLGVSPTIDAEYIATMDTFGALLLSSMEAQTPGITADPAATTFVTAAVGAIRHIGTTWLLDDFATDRDELVDATARILLAIAGSATSPTGSGHTA